MATEADSRALAEIWHPEALESCLGLWIAFTASDGVITSAESQAYLLEQFEHAISEGKAPLFAFVDFRERV